MIKICCIARQAFRCGLTAIIVSLCLMSITLLTPVRTVFAAPAQAQHKQARNIEPTQSLNHSQGVEHGEVPDGLSQQEWDSIQRQVNLSKYRAFEQDDGSYASANITNGWHIDYGSDGRTRLTPYQPEDSDYFIGVQLKSLGYGSQIACDKPQKITADKTKLTYQWNDNVKEV